MTAVAEPFGTEPSLLALGYDHIGIDDGWQACGAGVDGSFHSATGEVLINETLFPDMLKMTRFAHQKKVGCYWPMCCVLRGLCAVFSMLCALCSALCTGLCIPACLRAVTVWSMCQVHMGWYMNNCHCHQQEMLAWNKSDGRGVCDQLKRLPSLTPRFSPHASCVMMLCRAIRGSTQPR